MVCKIHKRNSTNDFIPRVISCYLCNRFFFYTNMTVDTGQQKLSHLASRIQKIA